MVSIQRMNSGDQESVKQFISEYSHTVFDMVFRRIGDTAAAREISRGVFTRVAAAAQRGECRQPELLWLMDLVGEECAAYRGREREKTQKAAPAPLSADEILDQLRAEAAVPAAPVASVVPAAPAYKPPQPAAAPYAPPAQPAAPAYQPAPPRAHSDGPDIAYEPAPRPGTSLHKPAAPAYKPVQPAAAPYAPPAQPAVPARKAVPKAAEPEPFDFSFEEEEAPAPGPKAKRKREPQRREREEVNDGLFLEEDEDEELSFERKPRHKAKKRPARAQGLEEELFYEDFQPDPQEYMDEDEDEELARRPAGAGTIALIAVMTIVVVLLVWMLLVMLMTRGIIPNFDMGFAEWFNNNLFKLY